MTRAGSAGRVFAAAMSIAVAGAMLYAQNKGESPHRHRRDPHHRRRQQRAKQ